MAPASKRSQTSFEEFVAHWRQLDVDQRRHVLRFEDEELVGRIVDALQYLQCQHEACIEAGFTCSKDAFASSVLLGDILSISVTKPRTSGPKGIAFSLEIKDAFLEKDEEIFAELKLILPDFLEPESRCRYPMSKVAWKKLWSSRPASFEALERQLAKTLEQAFWSMAREVERQRDLAKDVPQEESLDTMDDSWMIESPALGNDSKTKQFSKKQRRRTRQQLRKQAINQKNEAAEESNSESAQKAEQLSSKQCASYDDLSTQLQTDASVADDWHLVRPKKATRQVNNAKLLDAQGPECEDDQPCIERHMSNCTTVVGDSDSAEDHVQGFSDESASTGIPQESIETADAELWTDFGFMGLVAESSAHERSIPRDGREFRHFDDGSLDKPIFPHAMQETSKEEFWQETVSVKATLHEISLLIGAPPGLPLPPGLPRPPGLPLPGEAGKFDPCTAAPPEVESATLGEAWQHFCGMCGTGRVRLDFKFCTRCGSKFGA
eukprot:TRINITY_DN43604_c0_g1_i1.p1 TRINITY_DN43604_c0_g1~~TRINITY_DN43604_c0_g1_i1.p1  ORF type:complete len:494 (-),score=108.26 TRINITY_DN43604_c0_g1_i1:214-1695(-)